MGKMNSKFFGAAFMLLLAALCAPTRAAAQGKTFSGTDYGITFATGWDTVKTSKILAKTGGLYGMAYLYCGAGTTAPNIDSLAQFYSDSLGGHITKGKDSVLTLGKYSVTWQSFDYDSLPKLSAAISAQTGFPISLKKGSFRVYYLVSDGFVFTVTGLPLFQAATPYADIEAAIKTLKLGPNAGVRAWATTGNDLWIKNGRLGGGWFSSHHPVAVECFDARGTAMGTAREERSGVWDLPTMAGAGFLRLRMNDGSEIHLAARP